MVDALKWVLMGRKKITRFCYQKKADEEIKINNE